MDYCWWKKRKEIAHVVSSSHKFLGQEIYTAYCGRRTIHNKRKEYGKVEEAVKEGYKICTNCWGRLPNEDLMKLTHLL